jgi:hypothetical protein
MRSSIFALAATISGAFLSSELPAQETSNYEKALAEITRTADRICQSPPLEQTSEGLRLSGDAQAKLGGVIGKVVDLGVSGTGNYDTSKTFGVLQKDLIQAIQIGTNCKLEVFRVLSKELLQNQRSVPGNSPRTEQRFKGDSTFVETGAQNWNTFPKDVQSARWDCLMRLRAYGTRPEYFVVDSSDSSKVSFIGYLSMQITRDSSQDLRSIKLRIMPFKDHANRRDGPDERRAFVYSCDFTGGSIVASGFSD